MNLKEVQELKNSITEIRNDKNYNQGLEHIKNLIGSNNKEHQEITVKLATDSFKAFENGFNEKIVRIENMLTELENMLSKEQ
ncbi:hypothetical protein [Chryseobacterium sp. MEBOG07]|uniref:hypothetical protein n=1 Tax=Chryseobacterium sp. MEBOG07 TaxID=2879939 RepID=UPI001F17E1F0|nr:hypothetical protein [Chryseobacterium sp. MEBOG07]UKB81191.1 hypothetical protein LF886_09445 [Chryseobacterium sp. MEBOG07]